MSAAFPYIASDLSPMEHQAAHLEKYIETPYRALFWQMGTGKTLPIIATAAHLYLRGEIELLVVITLNGVHTNWVRREVPKTLDSRFPVKSFLWKASSTKTFDKQKEEFLKPFKGLKVLAMNVEAFQAHKTMAENKACCFLADLLRAHPGKIMGVVDESDTIGDPEAKRTERLLQYARHFKYRRIATGTPLTDSVFKAYSQSEFLLPGVLGFRSYHSFKLRYGIFKKVQLGVVRDPRSGLPVIDPKTGQPKPGRSFQKLVAHQNLPELRAKLAQFSDTLKKTDCLDLPEKLYTVRYVEMTDEQKQAYGQMKLLMLHEIDQRKEFITATNAMHKLRKLHDITIGFARDSATEEVYQIPTNRYKVLDDVLGEVEGKVIIFSDCIPAIEGLLSHLNEKYGAEAVVACYGAIHEVQRQQNVDRFQDPSSGVKYFVANQQTGGVGITLTAAQTVIFFSNGYSLRLRLQSEDRAHRKGQTNKVTYVDIVAEGTVDEKVLRQFEMKIDVASQVVDLFDSWLRLPS